jgi:hypothetical protein
MRNLSQKLKEMDVQLIELDKCLSRIRKEIRVDRRVHLLNDHYKVGDKITLIFPWRGKEVTFELVQQPKNGVCIVKEGDKLVVIEDYDSINIVRKGEGGSNSYD